MKNSKRTKPKAFEGAGYLIGAVIGVVAAITAFVFTESIAISIPLLAGLSIPIGIGIEQRFQVETKEKDSQLSKIMITLITIGVLFFFSIAFITKLI